eukprot:5504282-Prymnesium_polylepis.2
MDQAAGDESHRVVGLRRSAARRARESRRVRSLSEGPCGAPGDEEAAVAVREGACGARGGCVRRCGGGAPRGADDTAAARR